MAAREGLGVKQCWAGAQQDTAKMCPPPQAPRLGPSKLSSVIGTGTVRGQGLQVRRGTGSEGHYSMTQAGPPTHTCSSTVAGPLARKRRVPLPVPS